MSEYDADPGRAWDALSHRYDRQLWLERSAIATAVRLLAPAADERCVDVGTGTGEVLRQLAQRSIVPRDVTAIDASPAMLARIGPLPCGWRLCVGDVRRLELPDASCDALSAAYVLQLLAPADLPVALGECRRVLRPGGRLVTVTPAIPLRGAARAIAAALDRLAARGPDRYRGLRALDPGSALERAGFVVLRSKRRLRGYPSVCVLALRPEREGQTAGRDVPSVGDLDPG